MYWEYSLYAVPVILVTGVVAWLYLKWKGRAEKTSNRALLFGTATAILIALLMPVIARIVYHRAGLPMMASVVTAFVLLALVAGVVLYLVYSIAIRKPKEETKPSVLQESLQQATAESAADHEGRQIPSEASGIKSGIQSKNIDTMDPIDRIGTEEYQPVQEEDINDLLGAAMDYKIRGNLPEAVSCYRRALETIHEKGLLTQVVIDLCGLAKMMNNTRMIHEILNSEQGKMLDFEIKTEILNNI